MDEKTNAQNPELQDEEEAVFDMADAEAAFDSEDEEISLEDMENADAVTQQEAVDEEEEYKEADLEGFANIFPNDWTLDETILDKNKVKTCTTRLRSAKGAKAKKAV